MACSETRCSRRGGVVFIEQVFILEAHEVKSSSEALSRRSASTPPSETSSSHPLSKSASSRSSETSPPPPYGWPPPATACRPHPKGQRIAPAAKSRPGGGDLKRRGGSWRGRRGGVGSCRRSRRERLRRCGRRRSKRGALRGGGGCVSRGRCGGCRQRWLLKLSSARLLRRRDGGKCRRARQTSNVNC
jgi:hypothetical protein